VVCTSTGPASQGVASLRPVWTLSSDGGERLARFPELCRRVGLDFVEPQRLRLVEQGPLGTRTNAGQGNDFR
jgi:hypothetical protein